MLNKQLRPGSTFTGELPLPPYGDVDSRDPYMTSVRFEHDVWMSICEPSESWFLVGIELTVILSGVGAMASDSWLIH